MTKWAVVLAGSMLLLAGCDPGSDSGSAPTPTPTPDPLYVECTSTVPVDSGDPNQPVIALNGPRVISHPRGTPYADAGATATDPRDGDITSRIVVTGLATLDTNTVGDYMIRYNVTNSAQLRAVEVVRMVRVNAGRFAVQMARDIGSTGAHMGYYEHLPLNYSDDPNQKFPLIIFQHGWSSARFLDDHTVQEPLSVLEYGNLVMFIKNGQWDDSRPFIVLSPQRCVDPLEFNGVTAGQMKRFLDYAMQAYKVDPTRIYMGGHSQGAGDTWDYVVNYPNQLAAVFPVSGDYGTASGCRLANTPSWSFIGQNDVSVPYERVVATVNSINACAPVERARLTVFPGFSHNDVEIPVLTVTGLGQGMPDYDIYDEGVYDWLLKHSCQQLSTGRAVRADREDSAPVAAAVPALAPADSFTVRPAQIAPGRSATLRWAVAGGASCTASGDWLGPKPAAGTEAVKPAAPGSYNYLLNCGSVSLSVSLSFDPTLKP